MQRVFHPVAVHFKGSGFYNTDYGKKKSGAASSELGLEARIDGSSARRVATRRTRLGLEGLDSSDASSSSGSD